jgi:glutathione S-transferase
MALKLYGSPRSRTMRCLWMLAELGLEFIHDPVAWDDPRLKSAAFLALNPAGAIPTLTDGEVVVAESLAINLYLAKTYGVGSGLNPDDPGQEAQAWRWTLWAQAHLEPWVQRDKRLEARQARIAAVARDMTNESLALLDDFLTARTWLVGETFSVADLNVAGVLSPSRTAKLELGAWPNVSAWLERCYRRPAARETRRRYGEAPDQALMVPASTLKPGPMVEERLMRLM